MTDPIEFEAEQGSPPMLIDIPGTATPLGSIVWLDARSGGSLPPFMLRVRDEDIGQDLDVHFRIITEDDSVPQFELTPTVPGGTLTRDFSIFVPSVMLSPGECHRLDVAVSGSFFEGRDSPIYFDEVIEEGDLARGTFWIWEGKGEAVATQQEKARLVDSCNAIEVPLVPSGTSEAIVP